MTDIRSILVHVDETVFCPSRLRLAGRLADRFQAMLSGIYASPAATLAPAAPGEAHEAWETLIASRTDATQKRAQDMFAAFRRHRRDTAWQAFGPAAVAAAGSPAALVAHQARGFDFVIVGQSGAGEDEAKRPGSLPQQLVVTAGRPVLVVPRLLAEEDAGRRIVVAWSDSREAARALADAMPFLRRAERVCVVTVGQAATPSMAALDLPLGYLALHGVTADGEILRADPGDETGALIARNGRFEADLLVMGGYGHGRLRELVLGGMTREILTRLPLPVLMSH